VSQAFRLRGQTVYELTRDAAQGSRPRGATPAVAAPPRAPARAALAYGERG
jgi:chemotaxis protein methyltransferase CheR